MIRANQQGVKMNYKIIKRDSDQVEFSSLDNGDWFLDDVNALCMVMRFNDGNQTNHIEFKEDAALMDHFSDEDLVTPVNVEIKIK